MLIRGRLMKAQRVSIPSPLPADWPYCVFLPKDE